METIPRALQIALPKGQSAFLWGPRKTGKTTYLKQKYPDGIWYDFLQTDLYMEITKAPYLLREQLLSQSSKVLRNPVILDEVQKVPGVMDGK
ncbi:MAG: AAA family ATPase [Chitinivibrionales bacterium]|nr:AAA family ATPase [Chitinivibrionales bacterium]